MLLPTVSGEFKLDGPLFRLRSETPSPRHDADRQKEARVTDPIRRMDAEISLRVAAQHLQRSSRPRPERRPD